MIDFYYRSQCAASLVVIGIPIILRCPGLAVDFSIHLIGIKNRHREVDVFYHNLCTEMYWYELVQLDVLNFPNQTKTIGL